MSITLDNKQCLIAGNGILPVKMAQNAKNNGLEVVAISLSSDNFKELQKYCSKVYSYGCGQLDSIKKVLIEENIKQLTFIGKVSKTMILKRLKFEPTALELIKKAPKLNDDMVMLLLIEELEKLGITILDQTIFIKDLIVQEGVLTKLKPTKEQMIDIEYGYKIAREMGQLDIGQSVVMKDKMILAVEAIEGTDQCIKRGGKLSRKKGAVVVKVAKPKQDMRFDIPTVGMNTLRIMKRYGANVLALQAGATIIAEQANMIDFANKHKMVLLAV
ncbi:MAG: LpxI family protein [Cyanobacteria bacterium SIG30]|nr:LpxI family protein [Cyanobacteria bacterium SIG30]